MKVELEMHKVYFKCAMASGQNYINFRTSTTLPMELYWWWHICINGSGGTYHVHLQRCSHFHGCMFIYNWCSHSHGCMFIYSSAVTSWLHAHLQLVQSHSWPHVYLQRHSHIHGLMFIYSWCSHIHDWMFTYSGAVTLMAACSSTEVQQHSKLHVHLQ